MPSGSLAPLVALSLNRRNHRLLERTVAALNVRPTDSVLDVGFGGGLSLRLLLARASEGFVAGIEPSGEMVARAQRTFSDEIGSGRMAVEAGWAEDIPFPDATFDRVITSQTVYFWKDIRRGLDEFYRVMKPAGRVAVAMMPKSLQERFGFGERGYHVVSHDEVILYLEESGFTKVRPWPLPAVGSPWIVVGRRP